METSGWDLLADLGPGISPLGPLPSPGQRLLGKIRHVKWTRGCPAHRGSRKQWETRRRDPGPQLQQHQHFLSRKYWFHGFPYRRVSHLKIKGRGQLIPKVLSSPGADGEICRKAPSGSPQESDPLKWTAAARASDCPSPGAAQGGVGRGETPPLQLHWSTPREEGLIQQRHAAREGAV